MKLRYGGFRRIAFDGLSRLGLRIVPYFLLVEDCDAEIALPSGGRDLHIVPIERNDLAALAALPGASGNASRLEKQYDDGKRGLALLRCDEVAATCWYDLRECGFPGFRFALAPDAAYLFDAYTQPKFRGAGLAPYLRSRLYRDLAALGRRRLYSVSGSFDVPSLRFKAKLGARRDHLGLFVRVLGRWSWSRVLKRYPEASAAAVARCASGEQRPTQGTAANAEAARPPRPRKAAGQRALPESDASRRGHHST